ncbi:MAG: RDD family protein [Myxococcaceae bacterium]
MAFVPKPVAPARRALAGGIDAACLVVLSGIAFFMPLSLRGFALPMWGVLVVLLGYSVLPIAFLRRTFGLSVAGLEVVSVKTGHPLDLGNAMFRELIGRGFFPAAYLLTMVMGVIAMKFELGSTRTPTLVAGVMSFASGGVLTVAVVGHFIALSRPDGRSLADLMSGSVVVEAPALPMPTDLEEFDEEKARRAGVLRNVIIAEVVLALSVLGVPFVLTSKGSESPEEKIARMRLEGLQAKFDKYPDSEQLTDDLRAELEAQGRKAESDAVAQKHREVLSLKMASREQELRMKLELPGDRVEKREVAQQLISLLDAQERIEEARQAYVDWLGPTPTPAELAGFGHWLATNGKTEEAVTVLQQAIARDPLVAYGHTLLGVSLQRLGRKALAREELHLALLDDPKDEDAADALSAVEAEAGVLPPADLKLLEARVAAWKRDAGQ